MFRRLRRQIQCQHLYARTIYGDEINAWGFRRGHCQDCGAALDAIPYSALTGRGLAPPERWRIVLTPPSPEVGK